MLTIHKSFIQPMENNKVRLVTPVTESIDGKSTERNIWVEVDSRYEKYLCTERCDAMLLGLLHYALENGHDIQAELPASRKLYFNLQNLLIPLLCGSAGKVYKKISLLMDHTDEALPNAKAVGTGVSLGIDSIYTIARHSKGTDTAYPLTHLLLFNVGSHAGNEKGLAIYKKHVEKVVKFAGEYNYELVTLDSNYAWEFTQVYNNVHPFAAAFAVFSMQKLWGVYLYASAGFAKLDIRLPIEEKVYGGNLMPILNGVFANENMQFCADAEGVSRFEKTKYLSDNEMAQKYLYVCTKGADNCCRCMKCTRTILSLRLLGKLEEFAAVFPIEKCRIRHEIRLLLKKARQGDAFSWEIIKEFFKRKK